jgi:6-pyruvoyltetrahydropterin/6-carboxytetrahydropterin synthase
MTADRYTVRVSRDHLTFCSAHFISYAGHQCERLHGHNYRAEVTVEGPLDPADHYVFDFVTLKQRAKEITDELDHHMLLATTNPVIRVNEAGGQVRVTHQDREWVFPRADCVLLPIENTTAELLARHIAGRLLMALMHHHRFVPTLLRVEVEESVGLSGAFECRPRGGAS